MEMKRQEHTVNSHRHVSPHELFTDVVENPATPQQHCQVEVWPLVVENIAKKFQELSFLDALPPQS